jgi:hypothetical protein
MRMDVSTIVFSLMKVVQVDSDEGSWIRLLRRQKRDFLSQVQVEENYCK